MPSTPHRPAGAWWASKIPPGASWVYKSLDAVLTAQLSPRLSAGSLVKAAVRRRSSNYQRISAVTNLLDQLLPGLARKIAHSLLQTEHFSLEGYQTSLLAYGSGATVFLLENGREKKVLKVFRRSVGQPAARVWEVAREFQEKHHTLTAWFNETGSVVIPSAFLALHGPLLGVPAAAVVQPFVEGKKYDPFLDFSVDEVIELGKRDEALGGALVNFSRSLFSAIDETSRCFDLVGRENLMLVEMDGKLSLKIADNGILDIQHIRQKSPALFDRLQSRLNQLRLIQNGLESRQQELFRGVNGGIHYPQTQQNHPVPYN